MKWTKAPLYIGILIFAVVVGSLIGKFIGNRSNHSYVSAHRNPVLKTVKDMQQLNFTIYKLIFSYENVVDDFNKNPSSENRKRLLEHSLKLHKALSQVGSVYGLKPMRVAKLFEVWQHENEQKLLSGTKPDNWTGEYLKYNQLVNAAIEKSLDKFKLETYSNVVSRSDINQLSHRKFEKYKKFFDKEVRPLLPKAKKQLIELPDLEKRNNYCLKILMDGADVGRDDSAPAQIAEANLFTLFVYQGEYCPFLVGNKIKDTCEKLKYMSGVREDMKEWFNRQLALCKAVSNKRQQIEKQAEQKYGEYTYGEYYTKYVQPLVPKYEKRLKQPSAKEKLYKCDMNYLPVTNYRDPNIDAQIAAFERVGYKVCHDFFKRKHDKYS